MNAPSTSSWAKPRAYIGLLFPLVPNMNTVIF
jgi:hypothetical protein